MDKFSESGDNLTDAIASLRGWKHLAESEGAKKESLLTELEAKNKHIAELGISLAIAEKNAAMWKANHDNQVARCDVLRARPDLPANRLAVHDKLVQLQEQASLDAFKFKTMEALNTQSEKQRDHWMAERNEVLAQLKDTVAAYEKGEDVFGGIERARNLIAKLEK